MRYLVLSLVQRAKSPERGLFGSTGTVQAESRDPPAVLFPPLPPLLAHLLPPSRGGTRSPPGWDAPRAGRTDTSESETGILRGKTAGQTSDFRISQEGCGGWGLDSPVDTLLVKWGVAPTISWSHSNGMSPQTMSKSRTPRDQTVRGTAL